MGKRAITQLAIAVASVALVSSVDAAPKKTRFVSKRYGYSLVLPGSADRWLTVHAVVNWAGDTPSLSNPGFDRLTDMQTGRIFLIAARPVAKKTTVRKWTSFLIGVTNPGCTYAPQKLARSKLGGASARAYNLSCSEGVAVDVGVVHAHRGYFFICLSRTPKLRAADRRACGAVSRSFRFTTK